MPRFKVGKRQTGLIDINIKEEYVKFVSILGQREKALNAEVTYAIFYV